MWALFVMLNKSMNLKKRLNRGHFYFTKLEFSNFMANCQYESYAQIQNFSSISLNYACYAIKIQGYGL